MGHEGKHFLMGEYYRKPLGLFGSDHVLKLSDFNLENLMIKLDDGVERLILSAGGHVAIDGQMGEVSFNIGFAHIAGMSFVVKKDKTFDPLNIGSFGVQAVVPEPQTVSDLVQKFW